MASALFPADVVASAVINAVLLELGGASRLSETPVFSEHNTRRGQHVFQTKQSLLSRAVVDRLSDGLYSSLSLLVSFFEGTANKNALTRCD